MKKTIIKSTFYLILMSIGAKILSFAVRILLARTLSADAMNLYSLAAPTMVFVITLAQMGIPAALSKVIAQKDSAKQPIKASVIISVCNNIIVTGCFLLMIPFLAKTILKQNQLIDVLYAILPLIPMVTLSGILKGYLFGKQLHLSATACQFFEEGTRIVYLLIVFSLHPQMDILTMAKTAMLSVTIGEIGSSLFMLFIIAKKSRRIPLPFTALFTDLHRNAFDEVLTISIPMTGSRLIGSLTYFLEPIIMVIGLQSLQAEAMVSAYGQLNGYVLPILTMPSFITVTLSNFLLPSFTYHHTRGNHKTAGRLFLLIIATCFFIGLSCSFLCFQFSDELMQLFYHSARGADLLKQLAWPFAFYALQPPLASMLHALSYSRNTMVDTFSGSFIRLLCVGLFTGVFGTHSLALGLTIGMMITTLMHAFNVAFALQKSSRSIQKAIS